MDSSQKCGYPILMRLEFCLVGGDVDRVAVRYVMLLSHTHEVRALTHVM